MKDTLVIRLPHPTLDHNSLIQWLLFDEKQQKIDGTSTVLAELANVVNQLSGNYRVCVIAPAEDVLLTQANIPSRQLKQVRQALPFMVEELIARDIETVHLATPIPLDLSRDCIDVAVVQHTVLIHWLDMLHSNGLSPTSITVDVVCVPRDEASWSVIVDEQRMLIRTDDQAGLCCELDDRQMLLGSLLKALEQDSAATPVKPIIHLIDTRGGEVSEQLITQLAEFINEQFPAFEVKQTHYLEDSGEVLASYYLNHFDQTLNLLQGGYRVGNDRQSFWPRWRMAASIAAIGLLSYLLVNVASGFYFTQQAKQLDQQAVALYKRLFPNERRVVSVKKQMQNHLRQQSNGGASNNFLPLLAQTARPLEGSMDNNLDVKQLRFNAARNNLQLEVQSQSIEQLDQLKQLLADVGLIVDINSATERDNDVISRLVVRKM